MVLYHAWPSLHTSTRDRLTAAALRLPAHMRRVRSSHVRPRSLYPPTPASSEAMRQSQVDATTYQPAECERKTKCIPWSCLANTSAGEACANRAMHKTPAGHVQLHSQPLCRSAGADTGPQASSPSDRRTPVRQPASASQSSRHATAYRTAASETLKLHAVIQWFSRTRASRPICSSSRAKRTSSSSEKYTKSGAELSFEGMACE